MDYRGEDTSSALRNLASRHTVISWPSTQSPARAGKAPVTSSPGRGRVPIAAVRCGARRKKIGAVENGRTCQDPMPEVPSCWPSHGVGLGPAGNSSRSANRHLREATAMREMRKSEHLRPARTAAAKSKLIRTRTSATGARPSAANGADDGKRRVRPPAIN